MHAYACAILISGAVPKLQSVPLPPFQLGWFLNLGSFPPTPLVSMGSDGRRQEKETEEDKKEDEEEEEGKHMHTHVHFLQHYSPSHLLVQLLVLLLLLLLLLKSDKEKSGGTVRDSRPGRTCSDDDLDRGQVCSTPESVGLHASCDKSAQV